MDQNLVFQITSWHSLDYEYDTETENERDDINKYLIKIFGVTEKGDSVSVNLLNFTPYFFIKIFHPINKYTASKLQEFIVSRLPYSLKNNLIDVKIMKKKDFWGFTGTDKFYFARFTFKNINTYRFVIRLFSKKVSIPSISKEEIKYKLYESNIDPFLRMMHIRDIGPCGWVKINRNDINESTFLKTHCKTDIECDWKAISKHEIEKIAPICVASFDIECTSSHGDFPVPIKNYKKTAYELLQYFNKHCIDENIKDTLNSELKKIFTQEEGVLSKVYPKYPFNLSEIENKIDKYMDEIFNTLLGKQVIYGKNKFTGISGSNNKKTELTKDEIMSKLISRFGDYESEEITNRGNWIGIFPQLKGDTIIQIGTTIHRYGEKECTYKNIITVGTCDPIDGVEVESCETEKELLLKWRNLIVKLDPDIITGYNILGFDMSYLYERASENGIAKDFCKLGRIVDQESKFIEKKLSSSALGDNLLKFIDMEGRVIIDVMKVVQRDHKLDSYKLDAVANYFMKMNKHDVHPADIFRLQKGSSADRKIIADYCVMDCALCNHLIIKLEILANNIGMSNVCNVPLSYIFMRGQGIKIFSLVAKECRADDYLIPTISPNFKNNEEDVLEDEDGYEGAIVLEPKTGIYIDDPISVLDYASLYPSSMISENISHDSIILNPTYDNLEGYEYIDIIYDVFEKINDKKVKTGEKIVRFAQLPNGEKGTIPKILMKLLKQRKETRKKIEFKTVIMNSGDEFRGLLKENEENIILVGLDGNKVELDKTLVKDIRDTYDDFQKAVLDGLQSAYKVTANSLYGQCGAKTSPIYMKEIAACTTAVGRAQILKAKKFIEENYEGAEIVYGDSVAEYTPTTIRVNGKILIDTVYNIAKKYGSSDGWIKCVEEGKQDKEGIELPNVEVWTDDGWTKAKRLIRHELASYKKMIRITTHTGVIDVTDDHSLLRDDGSIVKPNELIVGERLLHWDLPDFNTTDDTINDVDEARIMGFFMGDGSCEAYDCTYGMKYSWALNNADMALQETYIELCKKVYPQLDFEILDTLKSSHVYKLVPKALEYGGICDFVHKYRKMMYDGDAKIVPAEILNGSMEIKQAFWRGLYDADCDKDPNGYTRIDQKNHISSATIFVLASSVGYKVSVNTRKDKPKITRTTMTKRSQRKDTDEIKKITEIDYTGYVYDFTTENHKFAAGVGRIIAHNTDSLFVKFDIKDELGNPIKGKKAIPYCRSIGIDVSDKFKPYLKPPHDLEWEKLFYPFILFSKKRYCAHKYEHDDHKYKMNSMGIVLKRRDNAHIVKKIYGGVLDIILDEQDIKKSLIFLKDSLNSLVDGKYPIDDLIITKSLRADYKDPTRIAHKVLAERMGERDSGTKPQVNDRIPYVYVQVTEKKGQKLLQGNRIEHPDYIKTNKLKPDYEFYITNQIMKPILQLYALILEDLDGYKKGGKYFEEIKTKLIKDKDGDMKKVKDKLADLREDEVKKLLFDPILIKLENKKNKNTMITDFFQRT